MVGIAFAAMLRGEIGVLHVAGDSSCSAEGFIRGRAFKPSIAIPREAMVGEKFADLDVVVAEKGRVSNDQAANEKG